MRMVISEQQARRLYDRQLDLDRFKGACRRLLGVRADDYTLSARRPLLEEWSDGVTMHREYGEPVYELEVTP